MRARSGQGEAGFAAGPGAASRGAAGLTREQRAQLRDLRRQGRVRCVESQRTRIGLGGQPGIDVAEVLPGRRVARVAAHRCLERGTRLVVVALAGMEHGKVVVRLGQFGVVLVEQSEDGHRIGRALAVGEQHALQEAKLRVLRLDGKELVELGHRLGRLAGLDELVDFGHFVGTRERRRGSTAAGPARSAAIERKQFMRLRRGCPAATGEDAQRVVERAAAILVRL